MNGVLFVCLFFSNLVFAVVPSTDFFPNPALRLKSEPSWHFFTQKPEKIRVRLGDTSVVILHYRGKGKTFIHLHQNEKTALKAAKTVINKEGGSLITLVHPGGRNVVFHIKKRRFEFDPNRIFTSKGIKKTLNAYSDYSPLAHREVNKLAIQLKKMLPKGKIIAVHNNSNYSLKNYFPGHSLAKDVQYLYRNPKSTDRNFFLFTQLFEYKRLKLRGFNRILQKKSPPDDGSLSVFLAKQDYINVEAGYDQVYEQIKMLHLA